MSYSICRSGGKMCDGCMECYDKRPYEVDHEYEEEEEEEEETDD